MKEVLNKKKRVYFQGGVEHRKNVQREVTTAIKNKKKPGICDSRTLFAYNVQEEIFVY